MLALDLRTVVFLSGAIGALMSVVFFFMHRDHHRAMQGLRDWAIAPLLFFLSSVILSLQGVVPAWLSIVLANLVLCGGLVMYLNGTRRFYGEPMAWWPWLCLPVVALLLYGWSAHRPDYAMRLVVVNLFLGVVQAYIAWTIGRHDLRSFAARFTRAVLSTMATLSFARVVTVPLLPPETTLFTPIPLQNFFVSTYAFSALSLTVGFVLLANERLRQQLMHLVSHDTLTGALSRDALFQRGTEEIERARRAQRPLSVMMLDLDHFKAVNDQYGHLVGDQVLKDFVQRVRSVLRAGDILGRFGGEEFMVILPETDLQQARQVAERIHATRSQHAQLPHCTVSLGVSALRSLSMDQPGSTLLDQLIHRADQALYNAKAGGRNRTATIPEIVG